ncbi:adenosine deaminase family protein [Chelatococcus asaccharovorans]|uniref:adenosine deaminase family protein n=1 Tax=Chelatococcus asaccharovorans TaxID=28210 RepID=UPI00224C6576|nr:adenosine deaminase [Chelatococcus asaccharovorans]CAH1661605.1 Adenosine deaminase [Chelatococcus asaccharovorans]CAH1683417.1 Adenosine deaminase [Chelatococcus asaccharovorans]
MRRYIWIVVLALAATGLFARLIVVLGNGNEVTTAAHFDDLQTDPSRMRAFLRRMPKGGDLHTHLSGAVYAERYVAWAIRDGLCLRRSDMTLMAPPAEVGQGQPCGADPSAIPVADAVSGRNGQTHYDLLINALSMRWFLPSPEVPSGHDQFFSTFSKFNAATGGDNWDKTAQSIAAMTVDQLRQYDAEAVHYVEFMATFFEGEQRREMAQAIGQEAEPAAMLEALERAGLADLVTARAQQLSDLMGRIESLRDCGSDKQHPGCAVTFRFIAQINRNSAPAEVFAQTALATALVRKAPHIVVGINYVGPEDYRISLRDYRTHMRWIRFLARDDVPVALHAGELWMGLVPPPDLAFHIRDAVETAGARRIGHGTAVVFERDMDGLLAEMRRRGVTVEIALTSSDVILGVRGKEHPITLYLAAGVPVVLATDDAGVSRIDLGNEYYRAARDHGLGYRRLKAIARNAIVHSFLMADEKQRELDRLDRSFAAFEQAVATEQSPLDQIRAVGLAVFATGS